MSRRVAPAEVHQLQTWFHGRKDTPGPPRVFNVDTVDPNAGDGVTDARPTVETAYARATAAGPGSVLAFSPGRTYFLDSPADLVGNGVIIEGNGAVIDCRGALGGLPEAGRGSGLKITGNENVVTGLTFQGFSTTTLTNSTDTALYGNGRLCIIIGNYNKVVGNTFKNGNGGAIYVLFPSSHTLIRGNTLLSCNNQLTFPQTFGAIMLNGGTVFSGSSSGVKHTVVTNNIITGQYSGGITAYRDVEHTIISKNIIHGDTNIHGASGAWVTGTMGIMAQNGAARHLTIANNQIRTIGWEGILLSIEDDGIAPLNRAGYDISITGNIIDKVSFKGIGLYPDADSATDYQRVNISDNVITIASDADWDNPLGIDAAYLKHSTIADNVITGKARAETAGTRGIRIEQNASAHNQVVNNTVKTCFIGIQTSSTYADVSNNHVTDCGKGISLLAGSDFSRTTDNTITQCTTGIDAASYGGFTHAVHRNSIYGCTTKITGRRNLYPVPFSRDDTTTTPNPGGTLVAGTATVAVSGLDANDIWEARPTSAGTLADNGIIQVTFQNTATSNVTVKSTSATDTRSFILVKVSEGV